MKILIRLPNWLGDVVMSTAFVAAVRQLYPFAVIDVIIKKELQGIAALIPGINHIHPFAKQDHTGLPGAYRFGKEFNAANYDVYFNLPQSLSSVAMAWASGAKQRIGFRKEGGFFLMTRSYNKPRNVHRVDEYISLLENFSGNTFNNIRVKLQVNEEAATTNSKTAIINFNSEAISRRMPLEKGRSIIDTLTAAFTDTTFLLIGSPKEAAFIDDIINGINNPGRVENHAGKTDLPGLCTLLAGSRVVLSTDSGPAHLANALNVPTVALFGAGNELNTAPYNANNLTVIRSGELICEPCVRNTCKLYGVPKCMQLLDEIKIINALSLYLK